MNCIAQNDLKITLKEKSKSHRVYIKNISHIQSNGYLSSVYFITGKPPITVAKLLKEFEENLSKYGFLRICRNALVNKQNIQTIQNNNTRMITMVGGENLTVSCRNYPKINRILRK